MPSSLVPIFHGRITTEGRLELTEAERESRRLYLESLAGQSIEVTIRKERTKRSLDQNAYLHAVPFPILADYFGDDIESTKLNLMGECWGWAVTASGRELPVKPHTSDMTVEQCSYFIDWLIPWAMTQHNVSIPLPHEVEAA